MVDLQLPPDETASLPGLGGGTWLPRASVLRRLAVVPLVVVLLLLAKVVVGHLEQNDSLANLPHASRMAPNLFVGGPPTDAGSLVLANNLDVDGVIDVTGASIAVEASSGFLHQGFLLESVDPGRAPTVAQLRAMVAFVSRYALKDKNVYLYDDTGGGRALVTSAMLVVLRAPSSQGAHGALSQRQWHQLSATQRKAFDQVQAAVTGEAKLAGPYAPLRSVRW
ncbi:MAG TPA: hypothetical protein VME20_13700 [Acidimicrobiales bacterium]|nr:hypothetical protein [Acidimicrobiales bacterium]